jgi:hypothetical protein
MIVDVMITTVKPQQALDKVKKAVAAVG